MAAEGGIHEERAGPGGAGGRGPEDPRTEIEAYALRHATVLLIGNEGGTVTMTLDEDEMRRLVDFLERFAAPPRHFPACP